MITPVTNNDDSFLLKLSDILTTGDKPGIGKKPPLPVGSRTFN
jgi:hypothetical protein